MISVRNSSHLLLAASLLFWVGAFHVASSRAQQDDSQEDDFKTNPGPGQRTFASTCAGCHGLDGRGSEKAPSLAGSPKVRGLSNARLSSMISNGIPGTGMPAFHSLSPGQVRAVVSYLHVLQGKLEARALPGDAGTGKKIFFGKGECSSCHTVSGEGGFMGPDLTAYGSAMSAKAILDAILTPARIAASGYRSAVATTREGNRVEGVVRNEDNFSVQLQTKDGSFHFLQKSDLQSLEYLGQSLMPTNYSERLSPSELNDLASYLMSAGSPPKPARASKQ